MTRSMFIESLVGNIKEKYFFEKKLGSGGYGAVYLAKNKQTGKFLNTNCYFKVRKLQLRQCKSLVLQTTRRSKMRFRF